MLPLNNCILVMLCDRSSIYDYNSTYNRYILFLMSLTKAI